MNDDIPELSVQAKLGDVHADLLDQLGVLQRMKTVRKSDGAMVLTIIGTPADAVAVMRREIEAIMEAD